MSRPNATHQALGRMFNLVQTQASTEAYLDTLKILAIICFCILPLMLLVKKNDPRAKKGWPTDLAVSLLLSALAPDRIFVGVGSGQSRDG